MIISHEWGHAVQNTWLQSGGGDTWVPSFKRELNADCLAGVFLEHETASGAIKEEAGDADAIFTQLYNGGGHRLARPSRRPRYAGAAAARFADGYTSGTDYCRTTY